jgi:uncharacterized iron-regulated membrane protein
MNARKLIFWLHLIAGISAGAVVLIMSITGVLLAYEKQIVAWVERDLRAEPDPMGPEQRLPVKTLLSIAHDATDGATPTSVSLYSNSSAVAVTTSGSVLYIDSYDGRVIGSGSAGARAFFRKVTEWHRYVALSGDSRSMGKAITGAANLVFLLIIASGAYLWLRSAVMWFRTGLRGKALYFNWHNVFGIWTAVPLFLIVLSATVISYPWATNLVYRLAGSEAPAVNEGRRAAGGGGRSVSFEDINFDGADFAIAHAGVQVPDWKTITLRLPPSRAAALSLTVDTGSGGQPQRRSTLTVDRETGKHPRFETFADQDLGRRARSWLRFVHTGEYYGVVGQAVAAVASFAGVMLVWTGAALSLNRFSSWRTRRRRG